MTNPCLHDMVKIGYASDVEARRKQLSTTALPFEYEIYATYETSGQLEDKKLHELIDTLNPKLRLAKNREFFAMSAEKAYRLLEAIAIISGSADKLKHVAPMQGEGTVSSTRKQPHCQGSSGRKQRPAINFQKCGIPVGAKLVFIDDDSVRVTVVDTEKNKVEYNGETTSLSRRLLKSSATYRQFREHPSLHTTEKRLQTLLKKRSGANPISFKNFVYFFDNSRFALVTRLRMWFLIHV